jgi:two-component system, NarL family, response regulator DevR
MKKIRLLIVDDHEVVRLGLCTLLNDEPDMEVVAEAGSAEQALVQVAAIEPDVVVMDIQLPGKSGLEACEKIVQLHPGVKVVMLTSHGGGGFAEQALRAGASGYVLKQVGNEELMRAIRAAFRGEIALDPKTSTQVVSQFKHLHIERESSVFADLSPREMDVLNLVTRGDSNKEIGAALNLTETTVRNYVSNMLEKLTLRNRIELATFAVQNHIQDHLEEGMK